MRAHVFVIAVLVLAAAPVRADEAATSEALLGEMRALRAAVEALTDQVGRLAAVIEGQADAEADEAEEAADDEGWPLGWGMEEGFRHRGPDRDALRKIKLPENATKEQVRDYVGRVLNLSERQNVFSSDDPQTRILARVGPQHLDVLVDALGFRMNGDMYVTGAIGVLAREEHKELILDALPYTHALAEVVLKQGWEQDARAILLEELRRGPRYLPAEWLQAIVRLKEPETYDDLVKFFVWGANRAQTYRTILYLPGIDLDKAAADAWEAAKMEGAWEARSMAPIAIAHGCVDALESAVAGLGHEEPWGDELRRALWRHTDARGTNDEVRRWFRENRDNLVWDAEARKFRVREGE